MRWTPDPPPPRAFQTGITPGFLRFRSHPDNVNGVCQAGRSGLVGRHMGVRLCERMRRAMGADIVDLERHTTLHSLPHTQFKSLNLHRALACSSQWPPNIRILFFHDHSMMQSILSFSSRRKQNASNFVYCAHIPSALPPGGSVFT